MVNFKMANYPGEVFLQGNFNFDNGIKQSITVDLIEAIYTKIYNYIESKRYLSGQSTLDIAANISPTFEEEMFAIANIDANIEDMYCFSYLRRNNSSIRIFLSEKQYSIGRVYAYINPQHSYITFFIDSSFMKDEESRAQFILVLIDYLMMDYLVRVPELYIPLNNMPSGLYYKTILLANFDIDDILFYMNYYNLLITIYCQLTNKGELSYGILKKYTSFLTICNVLKEAIVDMYNAEGFDTDSLKKYIKNFFKESKDIDVFSYCNEVK